MIYRYDYSTSIIWIGAGDDHCMALSKNGIVFTWGDNSMGQCGQGHRVLRVYEPRAIEFFKENNLSATSGAIGRQHASIITQEGRPYIWGANAYVNLKIFPDGSHFYNPTLVPGSVSRRAIQVCCGSGFNVVRVNIDSGVFVWGRNNCGQLGISEKFCDEPKFLLIEQSLHMSLRVEKIAIGPDFVVACLKGSRSRIYAWGLLTIYEEKKKEQEIEKKPKMLVNNPFAIKAVKEKNSPPKKLPSEKPEQGKYIPWKKNKILEPTIIHHEVWNDIDFFVDVTVTNEDITVLNYNGFIFGMNYFEFGWVKLIQNSDKSYKLVHKANEEGKAGENKISENTKQLEMMTSRDCLTPILYSYRKLGPHCMQAVSINGTYNPISCGLLSVKHLKASSLKVQEKYRTEQKQFHKTITGDLVPFPIPLIRNQPKNEQDEFQYFLSKPSVKNYYALPENVIYEETTPDPKLIKNMRI